MTMQIYLSVVSQFVFSAAITIFLFSILTIIAYYCWKMVQEMITQREKVVMKVKKAICFPKPELKAVKRAQVK